MKKIIIELDDAYADILTITAIGHGSGYSHNVNTTAFNLRDGCDHFVQEIGNNDVTQPHWRRIR